MHFETLILSLLTLACTNALPFTNNLISHLCENACISFKLLPLATNSTSAQVTSFSLIRPTTSFMPVPGSTHALPTSINLSITPTRFPTTRYTNIGDPVNPYYIFPRARQTPAPAAVANDELHGTIGGARIQPTDEYNHFNLASALRTILPHAIHLKHSGSSVDIGLKVLPSEKLESAALDGTWTTIIPWKVLLERSGSSGTEIGNGVEDSSDTIDERGFDTENENRLKSGQLLARDTGAFSNGYDMHAERGLKTASSGAGIFSAIPRDLGTVGRGNGVPPVLAEVSSSSRTRNEPIISSD